MVLQKRKKRANNSIIRNQIENSIKLIKIMIKNSLNNDYRTFWQSTLSGININNDVFNNIRKCSNYGKKASTSNIMIDNNGNTYNTNTEKANFLARKFWNNHQIAENDRDPEFCNGSPNALNVRQLDLLKCFNLGLITCDVCNI